MWDFLVSSLLNAWPYYLLALVMAELLLRFKERKGLIKEMAFAFVVCIAMTIIAFYQSPNSLAIKEQPILVAAVSFFSIMAPLLIFLIGNQFLAKVKQMILKHGLLVSMVLVTMFFWPLWVLTVVCFSGLDCL